MLGKMSFIQALIHTFSSIGTGGLTILDNSNTDLNLDYIEFIIAFFCILASVNFINYDALLRRKWQEFLHDSELRAFLLITLTATIFFTVVLKTSHAFESVFKCLKEGFIHVSAMVTTSGYATADYSAWPSVIKWTMLGLMIMGGCSSSTAGGIKIIRVFVMLKTIARNLSKRIHPRAVVAVKLGGKPVSGENVSNITAFILMYSIVFVGASLLLSFDGAGLAGTVSAVISVLSNNGLGFGSLGYNSSFAVFSAPGRLLLSLLMIIGRLELFTFIILFTPSFWQTERR
jgi:trk system potassium uptake protein TrkH